MTAPKDIPLRGEAEPAASVGSDLRLVIACPECGDAGWIKWSQLNRFLGCRKCKCRFLISARGELCSSSELPQTHYKCPRCRASGSIPSMLAVRGVACGTCRLPLVAGPDRRLNGAKEAAAAERTAKREALEKRRRTPHREVTPGRDQLISLRVRRGVLILPLVAAVVFLVGFGWMRFSGSSSDSRVRRFTLACLAQDWQRARGYLPDNDVQQIEFDRWRRRHFTSIVDAHRPVGDQVTVDVEILQETPARRSLRVILKSPSLGTRTHYQTWQNVGDQWMFDVGETLRREDQPVAAPTAEAGPDTPTVEHPLPGRKLLRPGEAVLP